MIRFLRAVMRKLRKEFSAPYFWELRRKTATSRGMLHRIYKLLYARYLVRYNASIPPETKIAECPVFPHGITGIFISVGAKIGSGCTIFHQVTIGSNTLEGSKNQGAPVIGDNVFIGCGAKIIGGVHIGNNVCIGAGCVVTRDIPDGCTVVMPEIRLITRERITPPRFVSWGTWNEGGSAQ